MESEKEQRTLLGGLSIINVIVSIIPKIPLHFENNVGHSRPEATELRFGGFKLVTPT